MYSRALSPGRAVSLVVNRPIAPQKPVLGWFSTCSAGVRRKMSTEPFSMKKAVEPYSPSRQITSPLRNSRRLTA